MFPLNKVYFLEIEAEFAKNEESEDETQEKPKKDEDDWLGSLMY
jgi:hypothetical protein